MAADIGQMFGTLGRMLSGGLADLGETIFGYPTHENFSAALAGEPMPMVAESRLLWTPLRIFERGAQGLVESAPKIGAVAALQAGGVPAPLGAGLIFGTTEQGFDLRQGAIAAALPVLGEYSGAITEGIASRLGISSKVALQAFNKIGGAGGAAAIMGADQWQQIANLPPDQRKDAFIDAAANACSMLLLGTLGEGKRGEESEEGNQSKVAKGLDNQNAAADATKYLEKSGQTHPIAYEDGKDTQSQIESLQKWAQETGRVTKFKAPAGTTDQGGAEHEVYTSENSGQVYKLTRPGAFGFAMTQHGLEPATPYFYLRRVQLMNEVFGSDTRVEGITPGKEPSIITSQPLYKSASESGAHPSYKEFSDYMKNHGFEPMPDSAGGWIRKADGIMAFDLKSDNFIKTKEGIKPVDLILQKGPLLP